MSQTTIPSSPPELAERARARAITGSELAEALKALPAAVGMDLRGANLDGADLTGLTLFKSNLSEASLRGADLSGVELSGSNLSGAQLDRATLVRTGMGMADLSGANLFEADLSDATLTGADLSGAVLSCATLVGARMRDADLTGAELRTADLRQAELSGCSVGSACFDDADLRGAHLRGVTGFRSARWYGTDMRDINFAGAYRLHRHVADENFLLEFKESSRLNGILYRAWSVTSDCGRSIGRWMGLITGCVVFFAVIFSFVGLEVGIHEPNLLTYLYFSIVTLTTLGYGDVLPASSLGQILVILEVCVGYMMLGGLISIFANKMARRAD